MPPPSRLEGLQFGRYAIEMVVDHLQLIVSHQQVEVVLRRCRTHVEALAIAGYRPNLPGAGEPHRLAAAHLAIPQPTER